MSTRRRLIQALSVIVLGVFATFANAEEAEENQIVYCSWCSNTCQLAWNLICFVGGCPTLEDPADCNAVEVCVGISGTEYSHRTECRP
jgi:hypothetical protein